MTVAFSFDSVIQDNGMQLVGTDADGMPELQEEETFQSSFQETSLVAGGNDLGAGSVHTSTRCAPQDCLCGNTFDFRAFDIITRSPNVLDNQISCE